MNEQHLLQRIAETSTNLGGAVEVGPGDDCAVVVAGGVRTLLTVDQVIEGRHFVGPLLGSGEGATARGTGCDLVARKAIARSVSDIAAMGGRPLWALATAAIPAGVSDERAGELSEAMRRCALEFGCPLVGGDLSATDGPMVLTVTVGGAPHATRGPVLRSGARVGDGVFVTGRLGGSLASGRHLTFEPRVREGAWLAEHLGADLHAMIDLSDGAGLDSFRIGAASGVMIEIDAGALPRHEGVAEWQHAAGDGEDYELLFTARRGATVPARCPETGTAVTRIGVVIGAEGGGGSVVIDGAGAAHAGDRLGFRHGER